jgi:hypothetical protein
LTNFIPCAIISISRCVFILIEREAERMKYTAKLEEYVCEELAIVTNALKNIFVKQERSITNEQRY